MPGAPSPGSPWASAAGELEGGWRARAGLWRLRSPSPTTSEATLRSISIVPCLPARGPAEGPQLVHGQRQAAEPVRRGLASSVPGVLEPAVPTLQLQPPPQHLPGVVLSLLRGKGGRRRGRQEVSEPAPTWQGARMSRGRHFPVPCLSFPSVSRAGRGGPMHLRLCRPWPRLWRAGSSPSRRESC